MIIYICKFIFHIYISSTYRNVYNLHLLGKKIHKLPQEFLIQIIFQCHHQTYLNGIESIFFQVESIMGTVTKLAAGFSRHVLQLSWDNLIFIFSLNSLRLLCALGPEGFYCGSFHYRIIIAP